MSEKFDSQPSESAAEDPLKKERMENLVKLFIQAEEMLAAEGRDRVLPRLPEIYNTLIELNKRDKAEWASVWDWNPDGGLTEEEFDALNLRRKLLSNATGIMTASGKVRHDLNKI